MPEQKDLPKLILDLSSHTHDDKKIRDDTDCYGNEYWHWEIHISPTKKIDDAVSELVQNAEESAPLLVEALNYERFYGAHNGKKCDVANRYDNRLICRQSVDLANKNVRETLFQIGEAAKPHLTQCLNDQSQLKKYGRVFQSLYNRSRMKDYGGIFLLMQLGDEEAKRFIFDAITSEASLDRHHAHYELALQPDPKYLPKLLEIAFSTKTYLLTPFDAVYKIAGQCPKESRQYIMPEAERLLDLAINGDGRISWWQAIDVCGFILTPGDTEGIRALKKYTSIRYSLPGRKWRYRWGVSKRAESTLKKIYVKS